MINFGRQKRNDGDRKQIWRIKMKNKGYGIKNKDGDGWNRS